MQRKQSGGRVADTLQPMELDSPLALSTLLAERAAAQPDELAYLFVRDDLTVATQLTYRQLEDRVRRIAGRITECVGPGERVLLAYGPGLEFICAFWACAYAGVVAVPIATDANPKATQTRLSAVAKDAGAHVVLTLSRLKDAINTQPSDPAATWKWIATDEVSNAPPVDTARSCDLAYLQYTSGSTSTPKGVMVTHDNVLANCIAVCKGTGLHRNSRALSWLPHFHDYGLVYGILAPVYAGARAILLAPTTFLRRPLRWLEAIGAFQATHTGAPNFAYATCVQALETRPEWSTDLASLENAGCGAEPINPETLTRFQAAFARFGLSNRAFAPAYGLAEATLGVTSKPFGSEPRCIQVNEGALQAGRVELAKDTGPDARVLVSCGAPLPSTEVAVVNPESGIAAGADRIGELWVASPSVGAGYWGKPDLTPDTFRATLRGSGKTYLRTGDLGFLHGGELFVTGRLKDMLIVRGRNLYPQDIEWTVEHAHAALRAGHGAAFGVDSPAGEQLVIVQEVRRDAEDADLDPALQAIRKAVADDHELPVHVVALVRAGSVPRTTSGKIQRRSCKQKFLAGEFEVLRSSRPSPTATQGQSPALNLVELQGEPDHRRRLQALEAFVAECVARHTRQDLQTLSLEATLIEAGLDSLTTFQLLEDINETLGIALPPAAVLDGVSLRGLAERLLARLENRVPANPLEEAGPAQARSAADSERDGIQQAPASAAQKNVWVAASLAGPNALYNLASAVRIKGRLRVSELARALQALTGRHAALRTAFEIQDGELWQMIQGQVHGTLPLVDLSGRAAGDRENTLDRLLQEQARQPFDLTRAPLWRARLYQVEDTEHVLLLVAHHLICDGWSHSILMHDLGEIHAAIAAGKEPPAPDHGATYADYVQSPNGQPTPARIQEQLVYWKSRLAGLQPTQFPADHPADPGPGAPGDIERFLVPAERLAQLKLLGRAGNSTLYMVLLAAFQTLLMRYTGSDDISVASPVAARTPGPFRSVVGVFSNTLIMRADLGGNPTFRELLAQVRDRAVEAYAYQDVQPDRLISELGLERTAGRNTLDPVGFALQALPDSSLRLEGTQCAARQLHTGTARCELSCSLYEAEGSLRGELEFRTDLFERATIQRLAKHFQTLLGAIVAAPDTRVADLPLLDDFERHRLLVEWSGTERRYPLDKGVHELFAERARLHPQAPAVILGERQLTYAELETQANSLAHRLVTLGVGRDVPVGVCLDRSLEMIVGLLAVLKAGGAFLPLDPDYPDERLGFMLRDSGAGVVLTREAHRIRVAAAAPGTTVLCLDSDPAAQAGGLTGSDPGVRCRPDDAAYLIYTSGSSGKPKGVLCTHRGLTNLICWFVEQTGLTPSDRVLQKTSISFDAALPELFGPLLAGAPVVLAAPGEHADMALLARRLRDQRISVLLMVPSALRALLDEPAIAECRWLRYVVVGGEPFNLELARELSRRIPLAKFGNFYGPTEASDNATCFEVSELPQGSGTLPIGRPIPNVRCYVLDGHRQPVPIGVFGELYIGGVGVARGYLNRPELNAERFVPNPFRPQEPLYRTSDLARYLPDGNLEFAGRTDSQVKVRGFRIELGEIEAQLARHPQVKEAAVVAREDVVGEKRLVAYVTRRDASGVGVENLRAHLQAVLPDYMVPSAYVTLESLPLTPSGKLDRRALPAPQAGAYASREYAAPQGIVEEALAGIWRELLHVEHVGRHDNFFELGGHSLLIVRMMERLRGVGLPAEVRSIYQSATLADLAHTLSGEKAGEFTVPPNLIPPGCERIQPQMLTLVELEAEHIERIEQAVPGGSRNIQDIYPLAPLQEGMLFHHLLNEQGGDTYVVPALLSVPTQERLDELIRVLQQVIDRRDILRTAVLWEHLPRAVQVVYREARLPVEPIELDPQRDALEQLKERMRPQYQRLDLRQAPLMRLQTATDVRNGKYYALLQLHHLVGDHESLETIFAEMRACRANLASQLPQPMPYRIHVAQALARAQAHDAEAFFRGKLADVDEPTAPFGVINVHGDASRIGHAREILESATAKRLRVQARRLNVSAATLFHTVWALVVSHTSGRDDIVFGSVLLGRLQGNPDAQRILGMFMNTLPLRLRLRELTVRELVEHTQRELVELIHHEQASLAVAQRCSGIRGSTPLFSALLNYRHTAVDIESNFASAGMELVAFENWTNYPLMLSVDEHEEKFVLDIDADDSIDADRVIGCVNAALRSLVEALEQAPETPAMSLSILPKHQRYQVLDAFNATEAPYPQDQLVHRLFEEQVTRTPGATAVEHEEQRLSYAELNTRANRLARYLRARGVQADQPVAVCLGRSVQMVVGLLGIMKAAGAYVPLDPGYPSERLQQMLADAAPELVLTAREHAEKLPRTSGQVLVLEDLEEELAKNDGENLSAQEQQSRHLVYVIYTSGSTGRPKGTAMAHRSMVNLVEWHRRTFASNTAVRVLQFAALSFDVAFQEMFTTLCTGGTLVLLDEWVRKDVRELSELLEARGIERLFVPPLMLQSLAEHARSAARMPGKLRQIITAGEQLRISDAIREYCGRLGEECSLHNHYGPTETHVVASLTLQGDTRKWPTLPPIGRPIANTRIYILDERGQPVPIGVVGEIYIAGANVARGYLHQEQLTQERFVADPFWGEAGARMYRTGDVGRWRADGIIEYLGRNDHQVKIRGFRVELGEIEAQLVRHEQVKGAAVVAREDGEEKHLVAYVTPRGESRPGAEQLRGYLKGILPEHMVPAAFVVLEKLPLTPSGKLDQRALPAPDEQSYVSREYEAPQGEVEQFLAGIWQELLKLGRVGRHDNFFELGGHSLLATQVISRIRHSLQVELPLRALFESPTISGLGRQAAEQRRLAGHLVEPPIKPVPRTQPLPVSFSQRRMWLIQQLETRSTAYNMPFAMRLKGHLNQQALVDALQFTVERHEAFRTTFQLADGGPVQKIGPDAAAQVRIMDFRDLPEDVRDKRAAQLFREESLQPFDLAVGPLFRFVLIRLREGEHALLWLMHHSVSDQWSAGIIARELIGLYGDFNRGAAPSLEPLPVQYADFATWQRDYLGGAALDGQLAYWREKLRGVASLELPTDHRRPARQTYRGSWVGATLSTQTLASVKRFSAERGATAFMTLLACFKMLLARYSAQDDIAIGSPVANRTRMATENLVGTLVNTLVMRTSLAGDPTFNELLARVRETALEAFAHQDLPFERLVDELDVTHDASHSPLVQVLFNVLNAPMGTLQLDGVDMAPFDFDHGSAQFDLSVSVETELFGRVALSYSTDLFEHATAQRMLSQYIHLIEQVTADPTQRLQDYRLVTDAELALMTREWNRTEQAYPQGTRTDELVTARALRTPRATAVSMGLRRLSYGALESRANQIAHYLRELGVTSGARVGVCLERSTDMLAALLAVMKTGAAYVPLDPAFPQDRLQFMAEDAGLSVTLTQQALLDTLPQLAGKRICLEQAEHDIKRQPSSPPGHVGRPDDIAYILYTSGSTGKPKGVAVPHRALTNFLCSMRDSPGCRASDTLLSVTTLSFDISGLELYLPLIVGARVELAARDDVRDTNLLIQRMAECRPTMMQATPATWRMLIDAGWEGDRELTILCGGETLTRELADQLLARCGTLWNMYGPTETTIWSTLEKIERNGPISIGRPIANTTLYILDKTLQPAPIGVAGELFIGGDGVAAGYHGRNDLTTERFIGDPFRPEARQRIYRTGDLARYLPDGRVVHLGRMDMQVKIRGFRIELGEVESVLGRHPAVAQAAVAAKNDSAGLQQLVGYVIPRDGERPSIEALRAFLQGSLPAYMVPSHIIYLTRFPLTNNNKVDLKRLPEIATEVESERLPKQPPRTQLEIQLMALWRGVLGTDDIGVNDNFFDLGGHSLKAAQLVGLIRQVFKCSLPLSTLLQAPSVAQMARLLTESGSEIAARSLVAIQPRGSAVPIFAVPGVSGNALVFGKLARLLGPNQPFYGLEAQGLDGKSSPFTTVEQAAAHYVREIQSVRSRGPYLIAGTCTGGVFAYEIAQQLRRRGEDVELIILETWTPLPRAGVRGLAVSLWPIRWAWLAGLRAITALREKKWSQWPGFFAGKLRKLTAPFTESFGDDSPYAIRVIEATTLAVARYQVQPYSGGLLNIIASRRYLAETTIDMRREWERFAERPSRFAEIAAQDSGQMFVTPHVEALAMHIAAYANERLAPRQESAPALHLEQTVAYVPDASTG